MTSGQDKFDAPSQLGFQRHGVAKFTATKCWFKTPRHRRDEPSKTKDIHHQCLLGVEHRQHARAPMWVVTFCSRPDVGSRVNDALSVSQISAHTFENVMVTYASIFTDPRPKPAVTISTRVGPGSRLAEHQANVRHFELSRKRIAMRMRTCDCTSHFVYHKLYDLRPWPLVRDRTAPCTRSRPDRVWLLQIRCDHRPHTVGKGGVHFSWSQATWLWGSMRVRHLCVYLCHRSHNEGLSRCRLVGSCVLPGEDFFT